MNPIQIFSKIGQQLGEYSPMRLQTDLSARSGEPEIVVEINSDGGSVIDGFAIFDMLRRDPRPVVTRVVGGAFSIASIIFLAGDRREMADNAHLMIHGGQTETFGDANSIRSHLSLLDKLDMRMRDIYAKAMRVSPGTVVEMMERETWFNTDDAIRNGLATGKIPSMSIAASRSRDRRGGPVRQQWNRQITACRSRGMSHLDAVRELDRRNPSLRQQVIEEANRV